MVRYNPMRSPHFVIYPSDNLKESVVWFYKDAGNGYECFVGTNAKCLAFLKEHMNMALPNDMIAVSDGKDAIWWDVLRVFNDWRTYEVREHGTTYAPQQIDRSQIKQIRRVVDYHEIKSELPDCLKNGHVLGKDGNCRNCGMSL